MMGDARWNELWSCNLSASKQQDYTRALRNHMKNKCPRLLNPYYFGEAGKTEELLRDPLLDPLGFWEQSYGFKYLPYEKEVILEESQSPSS